jgi:hypothetical protein
MVRELTTKAFAGPLVHVGFFSRCRGTPQIDRVRRFRFCIAPKADRKLTMGSLTMVSSGYQWLILSGFFRLKE